MDIERTNFPVCRLTAPKQATDLRVGAWNTTRSLSFGGTHIRQRVPCCWKWHSSRLHSSTSSFLARRRSFFKGRDFGRAGQGDLRSGLAEAEPQVAKDPLALPDTQFHPVPLSQVLGEQFTVPQGGFIPKVRRTAPEILAQPGPLACIQRSRSARALTFPQTIQSMRLKGPDPALHRTPVLTEQFGHLSTALAAGDQQQTMQPMVISGFLGADNFLLDGNAHDVGVGNFQFPHDSTSSTMERRCHYSSFMRHYLCRRV